MPNSANKSKTVHNVLIRFNNIFSLFQVRLICKNIKIHAKRIICVQETLPSVRKIKIVSTYNNMFYSLNKFCKQSCSNPKRFVIDFHNVGYLFLITTYYKLLYFIESYVDVGTDGLWFLSRLIFYICIVIMIT